jgi:CRP-like cAMP-binding protein
MAVAVDTLKDFPHFSGLGPEAIEHVRGLTFEKSIDRGEMIMLEGEPSDALYLVVAGAIKVFKTSSDGKEQILYLVRPGESLNDVPVFDGGPNPMSAEAMGQVVLYGIRTGDLQATMDDYPQVAVNATRILSYRARHLISLVEDLSFRHVINRVAKILLEYAGDGKEGKLRLTQQDMAAMAGTAREMIGRSLKSLEDGGAIRLERQRIVLTDRRTLREMAGAAT